MNSLSAADKWGIFFDVKMSFSMRTDNILCPTNRLSWQGVTKSRFLRTIAKWMRPPLTGGFIHELRSITSGRRLNCLPHRA